MNQRYLTHRDMRQPHSPPTCVAPCLLTHGSIHEAKVQVHDVKVNSDSQYIIDVAQPQLSVFCTVCSNIFCCIVLSLTSSGNALEPSINGNNLNPYIIFNHNIIKTVKLSLHSSGFNSPIKLFVVLKVSVSSCFPKILRTIEVT